MREYQSRAGKTIYYATRAELEALRGYRPVSGGRRGRACCPIHDGDNPTALAIDWERGWASCWRCGDAFSIRIDGEHPDDRRLAPYAPRSARNAPSRDLLPKHDVDS